MPLSAGRAGARPPIVWSAGLPRQTTEPYIRPRVGIDISCNPDTEPPSRLRASSKYIHIPMSTAWRRLTTQPVNEHKGGASKRSRPIPKIPPRQNGPDPHRTLPRGLRTSGPGCTFQPQKTPSNQKATLQLPSSHPRLICLHIPCTYPIPNVTVRVPSVVTRPGASPRPDIGPGLHRGGLGWGNAEDGPSFCGRHRRPGLASIDAPSTEGS